MIPTAPVIKPATILLIKGGLLYLSFEIIRFLTGSYRPILIEAKTIYLCKPATIPFQGANILSS